MVGAINLLNLPGIIKLFMSQINNSNHNQYQSSLQLTIRQALGFLEKENHTYSRSALSGCKSFQQIFSFFIALEIDVPAHSKQFNSDECKSFQQFSTLKQSSPIVKSKLSTNSTSSQYTNKSSEELTLIQQIQHQQRIIQNLKQQLIKTEKMVLITKRIEREAYRNIDEAIDIIAKKQRKIQKLTEDQELLLKRIKERDQLLEFTVKVIQQK